MKRALFLTLVAAFAFVGCSQHSLVNDEVVKDAEKTPIGFSVQKQNITKANLETVNHFNFGVWAWKLGGKNGIAEPADQEVMNNYLVGWSNGTDKGYFVDDAKTTTWIGVTPNVNDHRSPWFYEGLGTSEYTYTGDDGFYKNDNDDADYMSKNVHQYLRYWDLAYEHTNFYCYAPYNKEVSFAYNKETHVGTMTFPADKSIRDGYVEPRNHAYDHYDRSLSEYMYATGIQATNSQLADVIVPFKHMGAQLFIRFYEDIPGYKVEIIDLAADKATEPTTDIMKGIQATPAIAPTSGTTYSVGEYYTTNGATLTFNPNAQTSFSAGFNGAEKTSTPLMFLIPQEGLSTDDDAYCPSNLASFTAPTGNTTEHSVIQEVATAGNQKYSYSPTIYYPVAQPTSSKCGFTFHVSYRIIAEDNGEVTTVHNATVHVPYTGNATGNDENLTGEPGEPKAGLITVWQPNVKYTYTFKFTRNTTGTTNPSTEINPNDPTPSTIKALYPIVFDEATIEDFTTNESLYTVSNGTSY